MHPADRLDARVRSTGSVACVGLDPRPSLLPAVVRDRFAGTTPTRAGDVAAAFLDTNRRILDRVAGSCATVKPQVACYEAYGAAGWEALAGTVAHARELGVPVILDAKRADIGSTATHYGHMAFGGAPGLDDAPVDLPSDSVADWCTVNGYLGSDGVRPVLDAGAGRGGVFVLVRTSNPSGRELQDLVLDDGRRVDETMADLVRKWGSDRLGNCGLSDVGAVVGATCPEDARSLRERMPHTWFLVPGYGAQGASAADALAGVRPSDAGAVIVSSSRGITGAWQDEGTDDVAGAAGRALDAMNAALDAARR